jgi:hypothetical protein
VASVIAEDKFLKEYTIQTNSSCYCVERETICEWNEDEIVLKWDKEPCKFKIDGLSEENVLKPDDQSKPDGNWGSFNFLDVEVLENCQCGCCVLTFNNEESKDEQMYGLLRKNFQTGDNPPPEYEHGILDPFVWDYIGGTISQIYSTTIDENGVPPEILDPVNPRIDCTVTEIISYRDASTRGSCFKGVCQKNNGETVLESESFFGPTTNGRNLDELIETYVPEHIRLQERCMIFYIEFRGWTVKHLLDCEFDAPYSDYIPQFYPADDYFTIKVFAFTPN